MAPLYPSWTRRSCCTTCVLVYPSFTIHQQLGLSHATVERFNLRFETHITKYVEEKQETIKLGGGELWSDIECDEVTLSRRHVDADRVVWAQYLGLVQRGRPESLILVRLPDRTTGTRAPGPGPLRKRDWEPLYKQYIDGRKIILHTDSARAYESYTQGIGKTRVVHQAKRDAAGNWVKPKFTQVEHVKVSETEVVSVLAGTQYIDGFWRILRRAVLSHHGSDEALRRMIRIAQWRYWTMHLDRWQALASTF